MSGALSVVGEGERQLALDVALARTAEAAAALDARPRFPDECFAALRAAGVPELAGDRERVTLELEIGLVRAVAAADASTARILDGHFNGVERLALLADEPLRRRELRGVLCGDLLLGVWGADPLPGDGEPARVVRGPRGALSLIGVKTFCSGAGGVQRALVLARDGSGARALAYVDVSEGVRIDRDWYQGSGLRHSESHRVLFQGARVLELLGGEDELAREPYFSGDAVRTAAIWAGISERIIAETLAHTAGVELDAVRLRRLGEMRAQLGTIDRWLEHAGRRLGSEAPPDAAALASPLSIEARAAISWAARRISVSSAEVCGSHALVRGAGLDRARRDLDLILLQHRLDRKLVELGAAAHEEPLR